MRGILNLGVVRAIFSREFFAYFGAPTGYVFITLFVFLSGLAAFWQRFFEANLANLDQLNQWFPYLLIFLAPAITMSLWADEKRQGTEELLLTLPARDAEIVLGKYLAALGIYTVALVFSLSHVAVLFWLGSPDVGMLLAAYAGYWLMGAALLPLGLLASQWTDNLTVAFILGAALCALPVFAGQAATALLPEGAEKLAAMLSVPEQFRDLAGGIVAHSALVYFVLLGAAVLYLNVQLAGQKRWRTPRLGWHFAMRTVALLAAAAAVTVIATRAGTRTDVTSERVHSLSADTRALLAGLDPRRPVNIQAYLSPEVPRSYMNVRANLTNLLREYAALGTDRVNVRVVETIKYSPEAREARERYGIQPFRVAASEESASASNEIFLGLVFSSGGEEFVIPQFDRGLPVEYELTRSIRVVSRARRKKVGILQTGANLFGGFDFQRRANTAEWSIVGELKKQYEVAQVAAGAEYPEDLDVLAAVLPHTLSAADLARLTAYVRKGKPALVVVDPLPAFNLQLSPGMAAEAGPEGSAAPASTDTRPLMAALGVEWNPAAVAWDGYNPHPQLRSLPPEIVFVGKGNQAPMPFQAKEEVAAGLQEVVLIYPGTLKERADGGVTRFTPLLSTGPGGGTLRWNQIVQRSMFGGITLAQGQPHNAGGKGETLAARVTRKDGTLNAIVLADADFIGEQFFDIRKQGVEYLNLDNVTLALNSIDELAGERSFIALRKRRPRHRTLELVEARTRQYELQRDTEAQQAAATAAKRLQEAQSRLDQAVAGIEARQDLDEQAKQIMIANVQAAESRRLQVARANIEDERQRQVEDARSAMESSVRGIQNTIKLLAVALPPVPAFFLFLAMSVRKVARERARIAPDRRVTPSTEPVKDETEVAQ